LHAEIQQLARFSRTAGENWPLGWGKHGGLFDPKLDRLRARLLLLDAHLVVAEGT
jgi:hypothetical protein